MVKSSRVSEPQLVAGQPGAGCQLPSRARSESLWGHGPVWGVRAWVGRKGLPLGQMAQKGELKLEKGEESIHVGGWPSAGREPELG